ncbi:hypothetical protein QF037_007005 [Streptomyces canus]|nr:hypothetical protein [Streptomyces canus]MDQ0602660.1 hypothetical protein [Streptomyces canus]
MLGEGGVDDAREEAVPQVVYPTTSPSYAGGAASDRSVPGGQPQV